MMPRRSHTWTREEFHVLFTQIVKRVGPHSTWARTLGPGRGLDPIYAHLFRDFAQLIGSSDGDIRKEVDDLLLALADKPPTRGHAALRRTAAIEAGFIFDPSTGAREK